MSSYVVDVFAAAASRAPAVAPSALPAQAHSYTYTSNDKQRAMYAALSKTPVLPELSQPAKHATYTEVSAQSLIDPLVEANNVLVVAGSYFGDEGKGKTVAALCSHPKVKIIARTNSGENAGHTVFDENNKKFVFNLCPSGVLDATKRNLVGPEAVMDPISFMSKEVGQLTAAGKDYKNLFIGNVHIVAPYHKLMDLITSPINSSTLKGMSPIHSSKVRKTGLRLDHIFNDEATMKRRLTRDLDSYYGALATRKLTNDDVLHMCHLSNADGVQRIPEHVFNFVLAGQNTDKPIEKQVEYMIKLYTEQVRENPKFPQRCDALHEIRACLASGDRVLLEGPQSFYLSNSVDKFWESSTSAATTAIGIAATANYNFQNYRTAVINIHKAPGSSRVGIGANPCAFVPQDFFSVQSIQTLKDLPENMLTDFDGIQKAFCGAIRPNGIVEPVEYTDKSGTYNVGVAMAIGCAKHWHECGATTKKPRVVGLFDCVAQYEVTACQGPLLSISAVDRGDDCDEVHVCIAYAYYKPDDKSPLSCNGRVFKSGDIIKAGDSMPSEAVLAHCYPIVKRIRGWRNSPIAADKRAPNAPLPQGVCEFISTVEHFTKSQVISIGNGAQGHNIIYVKKQ